MYSCDTTCTIPTEIDFPRYNMKCSGDNLIQREIVHVVSCFPLHFMLHRGYLDYFSLSDSMCLRGYLKLLNVSIKKTLFPLNLSGSWLNSTLRCSRRGERSGVVYMAAKKPLSLSCSLEEGRLYCGPELVVLYQFDSK